LGTLDRPDAGRVVFEGRDVFAMSEPEVAAFRNRHIGFVFQFHHLINAFTALENVLMPVMLARGKPDPDTVERARALLADVGLETQADRKPDQLSGGQQQRVAIARALITRPALVLADEPTGNLDTQSADEVFELLRRFNRQHGCAVLVVTHDPRLAARCDRIITLVDGRIESDVRR
jgi:lipoprotein-releasing system ATP-binding protein